LLPQRDLAYYDLAWKSIIIEYSLLFILCGLSIKLALAPFHLWSLEVYEGSPTNSTIFFATITKISLFIVIIRLCYVCFYPHKRFWEFYLLIIGLISIFVGSFGGITQK
jgi:NADH-quinone oxidoreductase subunit N